MESLKKWNKRSEKVWLIISLISTVAAIVISIIDNLKEKLDRTNIDKPNYNVSKLYWFVGGSLATVMIALIVFSI